MIRIFLFVILAIIIYFYFNNFREKHPELIAKHIRSALLFTIAAVFIFLGVTGRLNSLFALIGVLIAFLLRVLPVLFNYAPTLHNLWQRFTKGHSKSSADPKNIMSAEEALEVLGLKANASEEEIIAAHRKLIQKIHPDRGGSDYLASKINLAKKVLLNK